VSSDREQLRLRDIVENIERIELYSKDMDFDRSAADQMTVDAVERCLSRLSEAAIQIGAERMAAISPDLPLHAVRGLGNALRHEYGRIDLRVIFTTVRERLPGLKVDCLRELSKMVN
jgi:uncharacterized protein with HEPN domain